MATSLSKYNKIFRRVFPSAFQWLTSTAELDRLCKHHELFYLFSFIWFSFPASRPAVSAVTAVCVRCSALAKKVNWLAIRFHAWPIKRKHSETEGQNCNFPYFYSYAFRRFPNQYNGFWLDKYIFLRHRKKGSSNKTKYFLKCIQKLKKSHSNFFILIFYFFLKQGQKW